MKLWVDPRYLEERERFRLRATCEHCAHQEDSGGCSLSFPNAPHREETHAALKDGDALLFCKMFEVD